MPAQETSPKVLQFGVFELDLRRGELRKEGVKVKLQDQPLKVLQFLLENPGQIVTREQLRAHVWPADTFVEFDQGLYSAMARLRDALGDASENPRFIQTVARRGYKFIAPVTLPAGESSSEISPKAEVSRWPWVHRWTSGALAGLLGGALLLVVVFGFDVAGARQWLRSRISPIRSLAVLPLQNLSNDPQQDYFADGMTDELITELAQVGSLRVISRTSAMSYKGTKKTLPQIARELNVDAVLEGSVVHSGDRVRITAQLIQAQGDRHIWARSYERDLRSVLALQGEIARDIVGEVRANLRPTSSARQVNPESYEAYLRGRHDLNNATSEAELESSISNFRLAIAKDPQSGLAYSGLAVAYAALADFYRAPKEVMPKAKDAATDALHLDETLSEAHDALGWVEFAYEWNWPLAEQHLKRALELNPYNALAHDHYAYFLASLRGRDEAFAENQLARELDPFSLAVLADSSFYFYMGRQYDRAIDQGQKALQLDPRCYTCRTYVALSEVQKGQFREATQEIGPVKFPEAAPIDVATTVSILALAGETTRARSLEKSLQVQMTQRYICPYEVATGYTALGKKDDAFKWLQKSYEARSICVIWLNSEPRFDPLRSDPRFAALVRQVGLPERN
ncbi:MAG TPA: winged helix-turn-helix domain-containing protein [Candidatus Acidoferrum sp.]|nr:winged helix-turn-helix domain-containing protein [Candidatus Acidoferrum sp.]